MYYKKDGTTCTMLEWSKLFENKKYKIVKQETLSNGLFISTVWLGLDHSFGMIGKLLIFETMVFKNKDFSEEVDMQRYSTEEEAKKGHILMMEKYKKEVMSSGRKERKKGREKNQVG